MRIRDLRHHRQLAFGALAAAGLALTLPAGAVVTATGANGALPVPALSLDGVGQLSIGCSSVLLAGGGWVLGVGHCAAGPGSTVTFGNGSVATIAETLVAPGFNGEAGVDDLSLMRLSAAPVGVAGYGLQAAGADGRTVLVAGYGQGGNGTTGANQPAGTLRYGYNQYENLLADDPKTGVSYHGRVIGYDFDDGSAALNRFGSSGLGSNEASVATGDSGGPSFSFAGGVWSVVGIHVAVADDLGTGFGGIGYDLLLTDYLPWIAQVTAVPEPASAWLLVAGLAIGWAARRQRRPAAGR